MRALREKKGRISQGYCNGYEPFHLKTTRISPLRGTQIRDTIQLFSSKFRDFLWDSTD
jgi:hypothetical protein